MRRQPKSGLTAEQIREAKALIGKMPGPEIAERIGSSLGSLKRAFRGTRLAYFNKWRRQPELVKRVCDFYSRHGRTETAIAFPGINVRSIVERYPIKPRQIRWTDQQIIEAAKMAGIISIPAQAEWFDRPGAHEGSIKSLWVKRFRMGGGSIHGMAEFQARNLVRKGTPHLKTAYWLTRREDKTFGRKLYLWVDMERSLARGTPKFVRDAISQMAEFQRWLFRSPNPKREILRMIKEREQTGGVNREQS